MYFTAFVLGDEYYWTSLVWRKTLFPAIQLFTVVTLAFLAEYSPCLIGVGTMLPGEAIRHSEQLTEMEKNAYEVVKTVASRDSISCSTLIIRCCWVLTSTSHNLCHSLFLL